jgi:hypothetical protein
MSKLWPLIGMVIVPILIAVSISSSMSSGLFGAASGGSSSSDSFGETILPIILIALTIIHLIAYSIANIRVGKLFNKGILFQIGMVILPFVFQPILGFWGDAEYKPVVHTD